jgi:hypothetical protein
MVSQFLGLGSIPHRVSSEESSERATIIYPQLSFFPLPSWDTSAHETANAEGWVTLFWLLCYKYEGLERETEGERAGI